MYSVKANDMVGPKAATGASPTSGYAARQEISSDMRIINNY
jgi:hypothetical protein